MSTPLLAVVGLFSVVGLFCFLYTSLNCLCYKGMICL